MGGSLLIEASLHQMIVFSIILGVGFVAAKLEVIKQPLMGGISQIVTKVLFPATIFYTTYVGATRQSIVDNVAMAGLAVGFYALITVVMWLLARAIRLGGDRGRVFQLCFVFGNTGFVGMPLILALFPQTGLVYMALFTLVDQLYFWSYGVYLSTAQEPHAHTDGTECGVEHVAEHHRFEWRNLISPNTVAIAVVFVVVLVGLPVPEVALSSLETLSNATSALSMMYLGALIRFSGSFSVLKRPELYVGITVKMILVPTIVGKLLLLSGAFPVEMLECFVVLMSLPTMTMVPILANENGHEGDYASGVTVVTLLASLATIPLVALLCF